MGEAFEVWGGEGNLKRERGVGGEEEEERGEGGREKEGEWGRGWRSGG